MYNPNSSRSVEKYSSAITLSDMEIFIFPELLYSLVLANIMSPSVWKWRDDPWFSKIDTMNPSRRVHRLKQFIMDHFSFNLDLDTWGLTTKEKEIRRFSSYVDEGVLAQSNALFGYEGDRYYFDIDIRKHFGLDRYTSNIIPYWKTETVEAMEAFRRKEGYPTGAGECVSLATLYAAAAYIVTGIPLDDIYLLATPLHSQNYLDIGKGIITNNRRIVTKTMWYNGTELSAKARRALENERITMIAHHTGYIHTLYHNATIDPKILSHFKHRLSSYLSTPVTFGVLANFLRQSSQLQPCFQMVHNCCGKPRYIEAEKVFHYEHSSKSRVGDVTQTNLFHEIEEDEFYPEPLPNRLLLDELEHFFKDRQLPADEHATVEKLKRQLHHNCYRVEKVVHDLLHFSRMEPRLPDENKSFTNTTQSIDLNGCTGAEDVVERLETLRSSNATVDLAFSAYRDLKRSPWKPFLKAAMERNPVSANGAKGRAPKDIYEQVSSLAPDSIYEGPTRLAQPDEVWNYRTGDGLEKALCFMNMIKNNFPDDRVTFSGESPGSLIIGYKNDRFRFSTNKKVPFPEENDFSFGDR